MTWLAPGGGADQNVYLTIRDLAKRYDFHLVVGREIHNNDFATIPGLRIHVCPYLVRPLHPWLDFRAFVWIYRLLRRESFDVIHTHETKSSLLGRLAGKLARCPFIIYGLHGVVFNDPVSRVRRWLYLGLEAATLWAADMIVAVSRDAVGQYHAQNLAGDIPTQVVYSGVELKDFLQRDLTEARVEGRRRWGITDDAFVVVNVGRFSVAKAQADTIRVFARLKARHPNLHLLLVGDGPEREPCEQLCEEVGVSGSVTFTGYQGDMAQVFSMADLHVLTSYREGLPRVVVEAALCTRPTVCYEVEGVREIIRNEDAGRIVSSGDLAALTAAAEEMILSASLRETTGRRVFKHARQWDHHAMVEALDKIYQQRVNG